MKEEIFIDRFFYPQDVAVYQFRTPYDLSKVKHVAEQEGGSFEEIRIEKTEYLNIGKIVCPYWATNPYIIKVKAIL